MTTLLCLETSGKVCSVAIHRDGKLLSSAEVHVEQSHASRLAPMIRDLIRFVDISLAEVDAVAVSSGPGSYTGLRIGASLAKGLCYSLNKPLIAVNTLELLASQMRDRSSQESLLCPMIDARRMEVYCMLTDNSLTTITPPEAVVINENSFNSVLRTRTIVFFGDGAMKCRSVIRSPKALFVDGVYPTASQLGILASERFEGNYFEDVADFEPHYLKEFFTRKPVLE
jgi:tRNA threonylcarbamoyladenosine biosynthesis protein TsaB